jgi:hypothetical protein
MLRFVNEEAVKLANMESIVSKALPAIKSDAKTQDVDQDWLANFFNQCRLVSDETMQQLWSRILAGEANNPGNFSKRTLNVVSMLESKEARVFEELCRLLTSNGPYLFDPNDTYYEERGILLVSSIRSIQNSGLIQYSFQGFLEEWNHAGFVEQFDYFKQVSVTLKYPGKPPFLIKHGTVKLTYEGYQLAKISKAKPIDGYMDYLKRFWEAQGLKVTIRPWGQHPHPKPESPAAPKAPGTVSTMPKRP